MGQAAEPDDADVVVEEPPAGAEVEVDEPPEVVDAAAESFEDEEPESEELEDSEPLPEEEAEALDFSDPRESLR